MQPFTFEEQVAATLASVKTILVILAVACVAVGVAGSWGLIRAFGASDQAKAANRAQAHEAVIIANDVASERDSSILRDCRNQNTRNRNTINYIHRISRQQARLRHISVRAEDRQLQPFVVLMDNAVPHQNCAHVLAVNSQTP